MRYIRILVLGLFVLTSFSYAGLKIYTEKTTDRTAPVLQCSSDILTVSVNSTESQLLQGVTAEDDRDGDLSDNTGRIQRKIRYSDYEPPKFELKQPLRFESGKKINISEYLTVSDMLDGDLTNRTSDSDVINTIDFDDIFVESSVDPSVPGSYLVQYHITTQDGYTGTTGLSVIVYE